MTHCRRHAAPRRFLGGGKPRSPPAIPGASKRARAGLRDLAFANGFGLRFKDTQDVVGHVTYRRRAHAAHRGSISLVMDARYDDPEYSKARLAADWDIESRKSSSSASRRVYS